MERGTLRAGSRVHLGFSAQGPQSNVLARYSSVAPSLTRVPLVVSIFPAGQT